MRASTHSRQAIDTSLTRRGFLAAPLLAIAACGRPTREPFIGYAFIANEAGEALAAVDLGVLAVARHIPLDGAPTQVLASAVRPAVYALTPATGSVHEVATDTLRFSRKLRVATRAVCMALSADQESLYVIAAQPRALLCVSLEDFRVAWRARLPEDPVSLDLSSDGRTAAVASARSVRFVDLEAHDAGAPLGAGNYGQVRFLFNGGTLVAPDLDRRMLSLYNVAAARLITNLPLPLRPDHLCFNQDGGQLFVTGEGMDAVVVVYPYNTPEVAGTRLAGRAPGPMAASESLLFIASPEGGDVSIMEIATSRVIAVVAVGADPGHIAITPDDEYALVLNRQSGDVAVLRVSTITPNRYKSAALLTVIPVGSRPVSAALRSV